MALVLSTAALQQLQGQTEQHQQQQLIPTPALVQEFINHGALQYKVYVMGEQVGGSLVDSLTQRLNCSVCDVQSCGHTNTNASVGGSCTCYLSLL